MSDAGSEDDRAASRRRNYELLRDVADADALHDLIVKKGAEILDQPIPYLVAAARHQLISNWRRSGGGRSVPMADTYDASTAGSSFWDPAERVAQDDSLRKVLSALAEMDDRDILVLWRHVQGATDEQILEDWFALGFQPADIDVAAIRKRRSRARAELRKLLE